MKRINVRIASAMLTLLIGGRAGLGLTKAYAMDGELSLSPASIAALNDDTSFSFGDFGGDDEEEVVVVTPPPAPAPTPAPTPAPEQVIGDEEDAEMPIKIILTPTPEPTPTPQPTPTPEPQPTPTPTPEVPEEEPEVPVVVEKVDDEGEPVIGATLQIIDGEGNIVDEWISDGNPHVTMLPEGTYTLHEKYAPKGYIKAADKIFTVEIKLEERIAGVDHDDDPAVCNHNRGVALYYLESQGLKEEAYCLNEELREPDRIVYDGLILTPEMVREYAPLSDNTITDIDLYNKILDIIYHRTVVSSVFPELTDTEVRLITEYAIKTYTSANFEAEVAKRDSRGNLVRDSKGNIVYERVRFFRQYRYDANTETGYIVDPGNGSGLGLLAEHWYNQHGKKLPAEYAALYLYLISDKDLHPADMYVYVYSEKAYFETGEENYQHFLGVKWFDPQAEEVTTYVTMVDDRDGNVYEDEDEIILDPTVTPSNNYSTVVVDPTNTANNSGATRNPDEVNPVTNGKGLEYGLLALAGVAGAGIGLGVIAKNKKDKGKAKTKK